MKIATILALMGMVSAVQIQDMAAVSETVDEAAEADKTYTYPINVVVKDGRAKRVNHDPTRRSKPKPKGVPKSHWDFSGKKNFHLSASIKVPKGVKNGALLAKTAKGNIWRAGSGCQGKMVYLENCRVGFGYWGRYVKV